MGLDRLQASRLSRAEVRAAPARNGGGSPAGSPGTVVDSLTLFFPCHDEAANVERMVHSCLAAGARLAEDYEVVVVDDGSEDGTGEIAEGLAEGEPRLRVVRHARNRGYGAALASGFRAARHSLVFYTDGDGQFDVNELDRVLPLLSTHDVLTCYRRKRRDPPIRLLYEKLFHLGLGLLFGLRIRDVDCAFKVYPKRLVDGMRLASTGALIDAEMLLQAIRSGASLVQAPVSHHPRTTGRPSGGSAKVILRAARELWHLWWRFSVSRSRPAREPPRPR
jgi:glycosyltransferase involved in cell wall biosynthesis